MSTHLSDAQARELAQRVGQTMFASDRLSRETLGMQLLACEPGHAQLSMAVRAEHLNGHQSCHGGIIFSLADSAFAFACNSHNHVTVGAGCTIEYLRPAFEGDVLTADAQELARSGRHGVYDVRISNQKGQVIALFRGKSTQVSGTLVPTEPA